MIVGLSGYARVGKDEAAKGLQAIHFTRVAFADKLREVMYALNPIVTDGRKIGAVRLQYVIDRYGWDGYKETTWGPEIRGLLQRMGTEAGRDLLGEDIWVNAALQGMNPTKDYVITDMRFPNEARAIQQAGGILVRINRPGVGPANDHYSEIALDEWPFDHVVENDGSITQLHQKMYRLGGR